jgi:DMSO/TMAO reductase YedYZ heme-binding membrane subunit
MTGAHKSEIKTLIFTLSSLRQIPDKDITFPKGMLRLRAGLALRAQAG